MRNAITQLEATRWMDWSKHWEDFQMAGPSMKMTGAASKTAARGAKFASAAIGSILAPVRATVLWRSEHLILSQVIEARCIINPNGCRSADAHAEHTTPMQITITLAS